MTLPTLLQAWVLLDVVLLATWMAAARLVRRRRRPLFFGPPNDSRVITRLGVAAALPPAAVHRQAMWIGLVFVGLALLVVVIALFFDDPEDPA